MPTPDKKFLDTEPLQRPEPETNGGELIGTENAPLGLRDTFPAEPKAPCADCAEKNVAAARAGIMLGATIGVTAGVVVAYIILKNRLAPNG